MMPKCTEQSLDAAWGCCDSEWLKSRTVDQTGDPRASPDVFGFGVVLGIVQSWNRRLRNFVKRHWRPLSVQRGIHCRPPRDNHYSRLIQTHQRLSQLNSITHTCPKGSSRPPCTEFAGSPPVALMRAVQTTFTSQVRYHSLEISWSLISTHTVNSPLPSCRCLRCTLHCCFRISSDP